MNGVTGRMGSIQHLTRSLLAIRADGGVDVDGERVMPEPVLVGRNPQKLAALAEPHGLEWSTDLEACLSDARNSVYFDAQRTVERAPAVRAALAAGKHVYCEKPTAESLEDALELARLAREAGVKAGAVQDKLFLPGIRQLHEVLEGGELGRLLSVRGEFGYWVFEGPEPVPQRPSWNYRAEEGGGIILDMFPHWRYLIEGLFGRVRAVLCHGARHIERRRDEDGDSYEATAEDAAYCLVEVDGPLIQINADWATRVYRDDLFVLQVDGTEGSAVAGLTTCRVQLRGETPRFVWNPDEGSGIAHGESWREVAAGPVPNAFRAQWEAFIGHVVAGGPFPWDLLEAAKGVQFADAAHESWRERRWIDVPELALT